MSVQQVEPVISSQAFDTGTTIVMLCILGMCALGLAICAVEMIKKRINERKEAERFWDAYETRSGK